VRVDPYVRTIDLLRAERFDDPVFVIGADQFAGFLSWQEPNDVLELTRLAVATRPGFPPERLQSVLAELDHPERVLFFAIEPNPAASRDVRALAAAGKPLDGLVPPEVARLIQERGLYRPD
jgi:nicotinate-nucleotide adenylyltransferase